MSYRPSRLIASSTVAALSRRSRTTASWLMDGLPSLGACQRWICRIAADSPFSLTPSMVVRGAMFALVSSSSVVGVAFALPVMTGATPTLRYPSVGAVATIMPGTAGYQSMLRTMRSWPVSVPVTASVVHAWVVDRGMGLPWLRLARSQAR